MLLLTGVALPLLLAISPSQAQSIPPKVLLNEPSAGATFTAPDCITLRVDAFLY
jgi:hypothetical protein